MAIERLQKILARGGFASRRAAERLIAEGSVRVNGRVVTELGSKADPFKDKVEVNGARVVAEHLVYVVLHKPRGVVTTMSDPEGRPSVREILAPIGARVFPVGRLDFATSGVLLATNDGDFAEGLMHPKKAVPKTYVVKVANKMETKDLDRWREGIRLEDGVTLPAKAKMLRHEGDKTWFELTIREGRNQQIRRMGDTSGFPVMRLSRVSFAGITSDDLRPGEWRYLTREELLALKQEYGFPKRVTVGDVRDVPHGRSNRGVLAKAARAREPRAGDARGREPKREDARGGDARGGDARRGAGRGGEARRGEARGDDARRSESRGGEPRRGYARAERPTAKRGARGRSEDAPRATEAPGARGRRARGSDEAPPRGRGDAHASSPPKSPRYGGGSPGRRGYDVRQDWGGGAGRGRTGNDREVSREDSPRRGSSGETRRPTDTHRPASDDKPRGELGGRGGSSRTTGTGGGARANEGDYRIKNRRR
jgi:23S rRNA pseudouridine2605 synthase